MSPLKRFIVGFCQGLLPKVSVCVLREKGKRQIPTETRGRFNIGTSIRQRPNEMKKRTTFGHWELDTIVSSRGKSKGCDATFAERKTRMYLAVKIENRSAVSMKQAVLHIRSTLPEKVLKTFRVDSDKEFTCYSSLEKEVNIIVYFADPYSAWQRGTNENCNGLLREYFPE